MFLGRGFLSTAKEQAGDYNEYADDNTGEFSNDPGEPAVGHKIKDCNSSCGHQQPKEKVFHILSGQSGWVPVINFSRPEIRVFSHLSEKG